MDHYCVHGKAEELIVTYAHPLFLKAHSAASKADNPSWREATRGKAIKNSKELISSTLMPTTPKTLKALEVRENSLVESPADPKLEPPIDPRVKHMMVQARTKADP